MWEKSSTSGKKKVDHPNKHAANPTSPSSNSDLSWHSGKKSSRDCRSQQSAIQQALIHESTVADGESTGTNPGPEITIARTASRKNFEHTNKTTMYKNEDQFQTMGRNGKRQHGSQQTFTSSMKGAAAHPVEPDQWMAQGDKTGKRQNPQAKQPAMSGSSADVPAAAIQKLRIALVKNSQRNASNLGRGLIVSKTDGVHTEEQMRDMRREERPQKKHIQNNDTLHGARLSIHQKKSALGVRQVEGKPTNHSRFLTLGISDVQKKEMDGRRQLKIVPGRGDDCEDAFESTSSLSPKKGSQKKLKRQLRPVEGKTMYMRTTQVEVVRGVKASGPVKRASAGAKFGNTKIERDAAGLRRGSEVTQPSRPGGGRRPMTPGGNSQIVFG